MVDLAFAPDQLNLLCSRQSNAIRKQDMSRDVAVRMKPVFSPLIAKARLERALKASKGIQIFDLGIKTEYKEWESKVQVLYFKIP